MKLSSKILAAVTPSNALFKRYAGVGITMPKRRLEGLCASEMAYFRNQYHFF